LFDIQDIIVKEIASRLSIRVTDEEMHRISNRHIKDLDAYELVLKARHLIRQRKRKAIFDARILLKKALIIDPDFCTANALLANSNVALVDYGWTEFPLDMIKEGEDFARNAKRKCPSDPEAHHVLALIYGRLGKHNLALQAADFAISLNPSDPSLYISRAIALFWSGDAKRAIENYEVGMRLGSKLAAGEKMLLGAAYFFGDRLNDSIIMLEEILRERPGFLLGHAVLAAAFVKSKKMDLARHQLTILKKTNPMMEIRDIGSSLHKKYRHELKNLLKTTGM
jgi:tetratricopeptide (TPR) repeat protein